MPRMNGETGAEARLDRQQFQVVLHLAPVRECSQDEVEEALEAAVAALVEDASGVVLGPVGSAHMEECVIDIEFTMEALSPAVLHAKMGEVLRVLESAGFEYAGSRDQRTDARRPRELLPT